MKKLILCIVLFLNGCNAQYISNRYSQSDKIMITLIVDEQDMFIVDGLDIDVDNIYICKDDCLNKFYEAEKNYVDGILCLGNSSNESLINYNNVNHIPVIQIFKQEQFDALKEIYPDYSWVKVNENEELEDADAYFYEKGMSVNEEVLFYQDGNENSVCELIMDRKQLEIDINEKINFLINDQKVENIIIRWIKK